MPDESRSIEIEKLIEKLIENDQTDKDLAEFIKTQIKIDEAIYDVLDTLIERIKNLEDKLYEIYKRGAKSVQSLNASKLLYALLFYSSACL